MGLCLDGEERQVRRKEADAHLARRLAADGGNNRPCRAAIYEGTTVSYDVRLISGALAECFDNPRMVFETMNVASMSAAAPLG